MPAPAHRGLQTVALSPEGAGPPATAEFPCLAAPRRGALQGAGDGRMDKPVRWSAARTDLNIQRSIFRLSFVVIGQRRCVVAIMRRTQYSFASLCTHCMLCDNG